MGSPETLGVDTPSGRLRGSVADGVARFRGVRYGEAPVGERRFRPPVPAASWTGERDALEFGASAHQPYSMLAVFEASKDEDCLSLNVWAPVDGARPAPPIAARHGVVPRRRLHDRVVDPLVRRRPSGRPGRRGRHGQLPARPARVPPPRVDRRRRVGRRRQPRPRRPGRCPRVGRTQHRGVRRRPRLRHDLRRERRRHVSVATQLAVPASAGRFHRAIAQSGSGVARARRRGRRAGRPCRARRGRRVDPTGSRPARRPAPRCSVDIQATLDARRAGSCRCRSAHRRRHHDARLPEVAMRRRRATVPTCWSARPSTRCACSPPSASMSGAVPPLDEDAPASRRRPRRRQPRHRRSIRPTIVIATYRAPPRADATPDDVWVAIATDVVFRVPAIDLAERAAPPTPTRSCTCSPTVHRLRRHARRGPRDRDPLRVRQPRPRSASS